jgi:hypothetical protein
MQAPRPAGDWPLGNDAGRPHITSGQNDGDRAAPPAPERHLGVAPLPVFRDAAGAWARALWGARLVRPTRAAPGNGQLDSHDAIVDAVGRRSRIGVRPTA